MTLAGRNPTKLGEKRIELREVGLGHEPALRGAAGVAILPTTSVSISPSIRVQFVRGAKYAVLGRIEFRRDA